MHVHKLPDSVSNGKYQGESMELRWHSNDFSLWDFFVRSIYCSWETEAFAQKTGFCKGGRNHGKLCQVVCLETCKVKTRDPVIISGVVCFLITLFRVRAAPVCQAGVLWYPSEPGRCLQPRGRLRVMVALRKLSDSSRDLGKAIGCDDLSWRLWVWLGALSSSLSSTDTCRYPHMRLSLEIELTSP